MTLTPRETRRQLRDRIKRAFRLGSRPTEIRVLGCRHAWVAWLHAQEDRRGKWYKRREDRVTRFTASTASEAVRLVMVEERRRRAVRYQCERCGREWRSRRPLKIPKKCPSCHNPWRYAKGGREKAAAMRAAAAARGEAQG